MTDDLVFPAARFKDAGGTEAEIAQLQGEFDRSDLSVQSTMVDYWAGVVVGDLIEYLENLRDAGHFEPKEEIDETDEGTGPESLVADPDAGSGRGTSTPVVDDQDADHDDEGAASTD